MKLKFLTKPNSSRNEDDIAIKLSSFLLNNTLFLGVTLSILSQWKKTIDSEFIEDIVRNNFRFSDDLKNNSRYDEYICLMKSFYNGSEADINYRRGSLLETIWESTDTYNEKNNVFVKVVEAQVYYEGRKISERDIDIVYYNKRDIDNQDTFIELHECKSSAKNTLREPLQEKHRQKLQLMEDTISMANKDSIVCNAYIITFDANSRNLSRLLDKYNFSSIEIITRDKIEKKIGKV